MYRLPVSELVCSSVDAAVQTKLPINGGTIPSARCADPCHSRYDPRATLVEAAIQVIPVAITAVIITTMLTISYIQQRRLRCLTYEWNIGTNIRLLHPRNGDGLMW